MTREEAQALVDETLAFKRSMYGKGRNGPRLRTLLGRRTYALVVAALDRKPACHDVPLRVQEKFRIRSEAAIKRDLREQLTEILKNQYKRWAA